MLNGVADPMNELKDLVIFSLENRHFGLHLSTVERIVRAVEVTPLPKAPEIVFGIINMQGRIIPVLNIRKRFCLPEKEIEPRDQFIIANTSKRPVALVVDSVIGLIQHPGQEIISAGEILPTIDYVEGVIKIKGDIILIHNLEKFLSLEEEKTLDKALKEVKNETLIDQ
jgi:purine-binding chemotaxis protein CheW